MGYFLELCNRWLNFIITPTRHRGFILANSYAKLLGRDLFFCQNSFNPVYRYWFVFCFHYITTSYNDLQNYLKYLKEPKNSLKNRKGKFEFFILNFQYGIFCFDKISVNLQRKTSVYNSHIHIIQTQSLLFF